MITSIRGSIHQGHGDFSEHSRGRQCAFMSLTASLFNGSNSVDLWTQTNIDDIFCHGDRIYLHALTIKMVPDANSLSIEELPEVATSQNNVENRLNYTKCYQGRIDRSYSLTLLDEIISLLHVALHSATVTDLSNDQFMNPLLPLYM